MPPFTSLLLVMWRIKNQESFPTLRNHGFIYFTTSILTKILEFMSGVWSHNSFTMGSRGNTRSESVLRSDNTLDVLLRWPRILPRQLARQFRALISHCLYKRLLLWVLASLVVLTVYLSQTGDAQESSDTQPVVANYVKDGAIDDVFSEESAAVVAVSDESQAANTDILMDKLNQEEDEKDRERFEIEASSKPWLWFPFFISERNASSSRSFRLHGYFHGIKTLVKNSDLVSEYPNALYTAPLPPPPINKGRLPRPVIYNPYEPATKAATKCHLDKDNNIPVPDMYAYESIPQHMPGPALGSYDIFGLRDDVCFDRLGRLAPYGLGHGDTNDGVNVPEYAEESDKEATRTKSSNINFSEVDWGGAQKRCSQANSDRFLDLDVTPKKPHVSGSRHNPKKARQAVVARCYTGFEWTHLAVVSFRALITEVSLKSGGEYEVHILLHVRDNDERIEDDEVAQRILRANVPAEFRSLVTLWSEAQMEFYYPGEFEDSYDNVSGEPIHGVYRSPHFPLQVFALKHPEYEHFWNWEMDMRLVGNYFELLDRIGVWAAEQPRWLMWERNERYYIPSHHGTWDNFTETVRQDHARSGQPAIFGPVDYSYKRLLRFEEWGESALPDNCGDGHDPSRCGVGEGADLITFNPIFNTAYSGWVFAGDMVGYDDPSEENPPRRASIVTAGRLSRRLLFAMHEEAGRHHHTMFAEMFPSTVALHHGLKAIYAPHPIFLDRAWTPVGSAVNDVFNGGKDHSTSGANSPFYFWNEHNHKGTTFYYHSEFSGTLWRRWLGYPQLDAHRPLGGAILRGGHGEESSGSGRMCLRTLLLHPIKFERPGF